jgi:acyl-coenzyme A synthetase/AMP-(fatty) acid ligase
MSNLPSSCVTRDLLAHQAHHNPGLMVLRFDTGESYTAAALLLAVQRHAAGLQALGVKQDDYVLSWSARRARMACAQLARRGVCADQHRL